MTGSRPTFPAAALVVSLLASGPVGATDLDLYAQLLDRHTREVDDTAGTRVDYAGLKTSADWKKLVASLEATDPKSLATRGAELAFWINAYNILAIETVLSAYPVDGIRSVTPFYSSVWKRRAGTIGGEAVTLHRIEHEILRPMGEPRIHAAIVCASVSCPPLLREPWREESLDAQFEAALRRWLANPDKGLRVSRGTGELYLSRIFDWFAGDFERVGGVVAFASRYASAADAAWIAEHADDVAIRYLDYDWNLNDLAR